MSKSETIDELPDRRIENNKLAVVLVSGGMDSCVTAAIAAQEYEMAFLHVSYGQRTQERELEAVAESALNEAQEEKVIPTSYVPFRNTHLLSIAVSWAEIIGASRVFIGAVEEDSSGYPDCRKEYYRAFNQLIDVGTKPETHIQVVTPLIDMRKSEIVLKGVELGAPLHLTWSCYKNNRKACGVCDSCLLRLRAFREAGVEDPVDYVDCG